MESEEAANFPQETFLEKYRTYLAIAGLGFMLVIVGVRLLTSQSGGVEFIEESTASAALSTQIKADISGAVVKPGVYSLDSEARVQDLLVVAGGLAENADRDWVDKFVNLAARVVDGSKLYIPEVGEYQQQSEATVLSAQEEKPPRFININLATANELETLPGVGEVTATKIIDNRPYGSIEELLEKKIVNKSTFAKIKDKISVY